MVSNTQKHYRHRSIKSNQNVDLSTFSLEELKKYAEELRNEQEHNLEEIRDIEENYKQNFLENLEEAEEAISQGKGEELWADIGDVTYNQLKEMSEKNVIYWDEGIENYRVKINEEEARLAEVEAEIRNRESQEQGTF